MQRGELMNTANVIKGLIRACVDDGRTLKHELNFVDAGRAATLGRLAREREQFVVDLERLGDVGARRPNGSWGELVREGARNLWVTAAGRNNGDALAICRHSRARTEARYDEAMRTFWPDHVQRVISSQWHRLQAETQELNQLQF